MTVSFAFSIEYFSASIYHFICSVWLFLNFAASGACHPNINIVCYAFSAHLHFNNGVKILVILSATSQYLIQMSIVVCWKDNNICISLHRSGWLWTSGYCNGLISFCFFVFTNSSVCFDWYCVYKPRVLPNIFICLLYSCLQGHTLLMIFDYFIF